MRAILASLLLAACALAAAGSLPPDYILIPGSFAPNRGPDGNSILVDAPDGLILVDTGRHPEHQQRILAAAQARGKPIAAIVNTHWHLDHSGGNAEIRAAFPAAELIASNAVEGALTGFLAASRKAAETYLASGKAPPAQAAEIRRDFAAMDAPDMLRATQPVIASGPRTVAGRTLAVNLAPFAATEGDVWLYDPASRVLVAGDLVVAMVPFMDTACLDGWRRALDALWATPFETLIPGHGAPMDRAAFATWRKAFDASLDCAASPVVKADCIAGWRRDAASFIPTGEGARIDAMIGYYIDTRLRAAPAQAGRYCPPR